MSSLRINRPHLLNSFHLNAFRFFCELFFFWSSCKTLKNHWNYHQPHSNPYCYELFTIVQPYNDTHTHTQNRTTRNRTFFFLSSESISIWKFFAANSRLHVHLSYWMERMCPTIETFLQSNETRKRNKIKKNIERKFGASHRFNWMLKIFEFNFRSANWDGFLHWYVNFFFLYGFKWFYLLFFCAPPFSE